MMDSAANDELTGLGDGVLLTSDLLMDRLGVYDLMTTKEVGTEICLSWLL